jgi:hypothetical protein
LIVIAAPTGLALAVGLHPQSASKPASRTAIEDRDKVLRDEPAEARI